MQKLSRFLLAASVAGVSVILWSGGGNSTDHPTTEDRLFQEEPAMAAGPRAEVPDPGLRRPEVHRCGPECGAHAAGESAFAEDAAAEVVAIDVAWPGGLERAGEGERVELEHPAGRPSGGRVIDRHEHADGRLSVGLELDDGGTIFIIFADGGWQARLSYLDRREAWLLEGDASGGTARPIDITGMLCSRGVEDRYVAGLPPSEQAGPVAEDGPVADGGLEVAEAALILNSLPGANGVVYLDFDGETVSGSNWNSMYNGGNTIVGVASGYSNAQIERVWKGVAEDFRPFNLNVTTDRAVFEATPVNRRTMVVFTPTYEWYGAAGGAAYVSVFASTFYDDPTWVFTSMTATAENAAEACAHETGHALGLRHDGSSSDGDYYPGHGSGATEWAPIMGNSYAATVTQWSQGEYAGATNSEDDLEIIAGTANGLGYRSDDHAGTTGEATPVESAGGEAISGSGVIETTADIDVFQVEAGPGTISLQAANDLTDPNLDIRLRLLGAGGEELAVSDSLGTLDASLSTGVNGGTYFIEVEGVGTGDPDSGYSGYASLGAYTITGTVPESAELAAEILSPAPAAISLPLGTGLLLEGSVSGGTSTWQVAQVPAGGGAELSSPGALSTRCVFDTAGEYRLRLQVDNGAENTEDELVVSVEAPGDAQVHANCGAAVDLGPDRGVYDTSTLLDPVVTDDGVPVPASLSYSWSLLSGDGSLSGTAVEQVTLSFGSAGPVALRLVVSDGEIETFGEVVLDGCFTNAVVLASADQGRVLVPVSGSLGLSWTAIGFADGGWQSGQLGVGYDSAKKAANRIFAPLIGSGLDIKSAMFEEQPGCYLRVPFQLTSAAAVRRLDLRMKYDDGFVAYINGVEVARSNVPAGVPAWDSVASGDRTDQSALTFETFALSVPPGVLVDGTNVLAVHGLNSAVATNQVNEKRFVLVPELEALLAQLPFEATVAVVTDLQARGVAADPDGDGWNNLFEHAFGGSPDEEDSLVIHEVREERKLWLLLPESAPGDVRYEIERCTMLGDPWVVMATKNGAGDWSGLAPVGQVAAGSGRVWIEFEGDTAERAFYRICVSLIVP